MNLKILSITPNVKYKNSSRLRVKNYRTTGLYKRDASLELPLKRLTMIINPVGV